MPLSLQRAKNDMILLVYLTTKHIVCKCINIFLIMNVNKEKMYELKRKVRERLEVVLSPMLFRNKSNSVSGFVYPFFVGMQLG